MKDITVGRKSIDTDLGRTKDVSGWRNDEADCR